MANQLLTVGLVQAENLTCKNWILKNGVLDLKLVKIQMAIHLEKGLAMIERAARQRAQFIILPELFTTGYNLDLLGNYYLDLAETKAGRSMEAFKLAAKKHGVYIQVGFPENRGATGVVYNSVAIIGPDGKLMGTYAKSHLFGNEGLIFAKGDQLAVYQGDFGKFAPQICYDIGFPESARVCALQGAVLFTISAAWCKADEDIWQNNLIARTTDNLCFAAAANSVSNPLSQSLIGSSRIYGPRGILIGRAAWQEEDILVAKLNLAAVKAARRRCYYFSDRRPDLYHKIIDLE